MITDNPDKQEALRLGEEAGEEYALALYAKRGLHALVSTLRPGPHAGYAQAFYELWEGGDETWLEHAMAERLAAQAKVHPHHYRAFDMRFAVGARRCAEMLVRGFLDARAGVSLTAPDGDSVEALRAQLEHRIRRTQLGGRQHPTNAYETGYRLYLSEAAEGAPSHG